MICYSYGAGTERIGVVVKKTPTGLIDVDFGNYKMRFRKDGSERGKKGCICDRCWIEHYTEEEEERIKEANRTKELAYKISKCRFRDFSLESLEKIWEICEKEKLKNEAD